MEGCLTKQEALLFISPSCPTPTPKQQQPMQVITKGTIK